MHEKQKSGFIIRQERLSEMARLKERLENAQNLFGPRGIRVRKGIHERLTRLREMERKSHNKYPAESTALLLLQMGRR